MGKKKKVIAYEEVSKKNQIIDFKNYLEINQMDHTRFFCFQPSDFINPQPDYYWDKIIIDFTNILQQSFEVFWSTAKFNISFQQSLESFLINGKISLIPRVHQIMFRTFSRLIFHKEENAEKSSCFGIDNIIYDEYLLDVVKFFDLIQIYPNNSETIKQMIKITFNKDYVQNFYDTIDHLKNIIKKSLDSLIDMSQEQKFEDEFLINKNRVCLILSLENITYTLSQTFDYFDKQCIHYISKHLELFHLLENIYYQSSRAINQWKTQEFNLKLKQIKQNIVKIFTQVFKNWQNGLNIPIQIIQDFVVQFGNLYKFGKKNQKETILLKHLAKRFDFQSFLSDKEIDQTKKDSFLHVIKSFQKNSQNQEIELQDQEESEESSDFQDIVIEQPEKIKTEIIHKFVPKEDEEDAEERQKLAQFIKMQMEREYDDEFDDAFVPNRMRFENKQEETYNQESEDEEEEQEEKQTLQEKRAENEKFQKMYKKNPYDRGQKKNDKYNDEPDDQTQQKKKGQFKHYTHIVQKQKQGQYLIQKNTQSIQKETKDMHRKKIEINRNIKNSLDYSLNKCINHSCSF